MYGVVIMAIIYVRAVCVPLWYMCVRGNGFLFKKKIIIKKIELP